MKAKELKARFDDKAGAQSLVDLCQELKLSARELEHLGETVFGRSPDIALEAFLRHHAKGKEKSARFLMNLLPARKSLHERGLDANLARV